MSEHKLTYVRLVGKLGAGAGPGTFFSVVMPNADGEYLPLGVVSDGEGLVGSMYEEEALSMIHDRTAVPCDEHGTPDRVAILDRKLADNDGIFAASDMTSEEWDQLYDELGKARATIQKAQEDKPFYYAFNPDEPVSAHLPDAWRISTQKTVTARFERNVTIPGIELHEVTIAGRIRFEAGYFFFTIRNLSFPLTPVELGIEEEHVAAIGEAINERNARLGWVNPFDEATDTKEQGSVTTIVQPSVMPLVFAAAHASRDRYSYTFDDKGRPVARYIQGKSRLDIIGRNPAKLELRHRDADPEAVKAFVLKELGADIRALDEMATDILVLAVVAFCDQTDGTKPEAAFRVTFNDYCKNSKIRPEHKTPAMRRDFADHMEFLMDQNRLLLQTSDTLHVTDPKS